MAEQTGDDNIALRTIAATTGQFTHNFLKIVAQENPGNLITSALSAQVVLATAAYGAGGTTATQMRSVLFIPRDDKLGQSGYKSLMESFNCVTGVELRIANKIYTASQFTVKSAYKELTAEQFLSATQELDFVADPIGAANTINAWCEERTNKRIKDVIYPHDSLNSDTKLILVNAVYFKGEWVEKFDRLWTNDRPFHIDENTTKDVPTMYIKEEFRFGDLPQLSARFIELPYRGNQFSMIIILPNEVDGLKTVMDNLHQLNLSESLQQTHPSKIELFLPKFKIESSLDLVEPLKKLGMTEMFTDEANFSGITDTSIKISKVIQKAFIEVNEDGSEAAAVTTMIAVGCCPTPFFEPPPTFIVDRPYYYTIYHRSTGASLFTGIVKLPKLA